MHILRGLEKGLGLGDFEKKYPASAYGKKKNPAQEHHPKKN